MPATKPKTPRTQRKYLTLADAAEMLDVHPKTLRRAIADGRLRGYQLGGKKRYRILLDDAVAFLEPIQVTRPGGDK
ncbi:hypothetical protein GCM10009743_42110 [Kribbella swartbergensis]